MVCASRFIIVGRPQVYAALLRRLSDCFAVAPLPTDTPIYRFIYPTGAVVTFILRIHFTTVDAAPRVRVARGIYAFTPFENFQHFGNFSLDAFTLRYGYAAATSCVTALPSASGWLSFLGGFWQPHFSGLPCAHTNTHYLPR